MVRKTGCVRDLTDQIMRRSEATVTRLELTKIGAI